MTEPLDVFLSSYSSPDPLTLVLLLGCTVALLLALVSLRRYRAANQALHKVQAQQRVIMDTLSEGLVTLDSQRSIKHSNRALQTMFGHRADELVGMHIQDLLPANASGFANTLSAPPSSMLSPSQQPVLKALAMHKDGHLFPVHLSFRRIDVQGERHHVGVITDESQMAAVHESAQEARSELDSFVAALDKHSIFSATDAKGKLIYGNAEFFDICGHEPQELLGQSHSLLSSGMHDEAFWLSIWNTLRSGVAWRGEICNRRKNGTLYWVNSLTAAVRDASGQITQIGRAHV